MAVRISEIALKAGLSRQTVSNILNGKGHLFTVDTRELVLRLSQAMGYRPNAVARALRSGRFNAIGLISSAEVRYASSLQTAALEGIEEITSNHDLHLVSGRFSDEKLVVENAIPKILRELFVDGLLINYTYRIPPEFLEQAAAVGGIPSVWLNIRRDFDCVRPNDFQGGETVTEYLLSMGHRRIAYLDSRHTEEGIKGKDVESFHYSVRDRYAGYAQSMESAGLKPQLICRLPHLTKQEVIPLFLEQMASKDRPTAIIGYGEHGFGSLLLALADRGMKVPRDLSLVLFASREFDLAGIPFDYVLVPHYQVGRTAVELLLHKIESPAIRFPVEVLPCQMRRLGATVAPPPSA